MIVVPSLAWIDALSSAFYPTQGETVYDYEKLKPELSSDDGTRLLLSLRDRVMILLETAGVCTYEALTLRTTGDSWLTAAAVQRLVELDMIRPLTASTPPYSLDTVFGPGERYPRLLVSTLKRR